MQLIVSYPGNCMDAQQAARAYYERRALAAFVTGLTFNDKSMATRLNARLPSELSTQLRKQLRRREITQVPPELVISTYPWLETFRTGLSKFIRNPIYADMVWDALSHQFDRNVARRYLNGIQAVHAYEYTAKDTFDEAKRRGIARILSLPSTDSKEFEEIRKQEESRFPELRIPVHRYFADRFTRRYERRCVEIALADQVVVNSEVAKRSHTKAGADPAKILVVPLAASPIVNAITKPDSSIDQPLSVVWAGTVSIRKGAHYFIDGWRALGDGNHARAFVYGQVNVPLRAFQPVPQGIEFMGSVPHSDLFAAFEKADVLIFPTLADGFGLVVTEAFSRGLPVITTANAGASELVEHERNGLIIPAGSAGAITDALRWCLDNRKALYQMRFRALETARRWQWSDYRRLLIAKISEGLRRTGYPANFGPDIAGCNGSPR